MTNSKTARLNEMFELIDTMLVWQHRLAYATSLRDTCHNFVQSALREIERAATIAPNKMSQQSIRQHQEIYRLYFIRERKIEEACVVCRKEISKLQAKMYAVIDTDNPNL